MRSQRAKLNTFLLSFFWDLQVSFGICRSLSAECPDDLSQPTLLALLRHALQKPLYPLTWLTWLTQFCGSLLGSAGLFLQSVLTIRVSQHYLHYCDTTFSTPFWCFWDYFNFEQQIAVDLYYTFRPGLRREWVHTFSSNPQGTLIYNLICGTTS